MQKDQILAALPKLARNDLEAVHAITSSLLGGPTGAINQPLGVAPLAVFSALQATTGAAIAYENMPPALQKQFAQRAVTLVQYFNEEFKGWADNKITQQAFCRHVLGLLKTDLEWMLGGGQSIGVMIKNLHRVPAIIDDAYPDYVKCGMGYVILKPFKVKNAKLDKNAGVVKKSRS